MFINFPCWITTIFGAMMSTSLVPFGAYHFWLIATAKTTNEEMRGRYEMWEGNPYDRGSCVTNCKVSFTTYPSMVFDDGYQACTVNDQAQGDNENQQMWVHMQDQRYEVKSRDIEKPSIFAAIDVDHD